MAEKLVAGKSKTMWQFLISCVLCFHLCDTYSTGPPFGVCVDLFPLHQKDAQPQTVILNTTGSEINTFFNGAMVQARKSNCRRMEGVGMFTLPENETKMGYMTCQGGERNTVAHTNNVQVDQRVFYWTAPSPAVGHIFFRATVVGNKETFWTTVTSDYIRDASDNTTTPTDKCLSWVRTKIDPCPATTTQQPTELNTASMTTPSYLTLFGFLVSIVLFC